MESQPGSRLIDGLLSLAETLTADFALETRLTSLCRITTELLRCDRSSIFLREKDAYRGSFNYGNPPDIAARFRRARFPFDHPAVKEVERTRTYLLIEDARSSPFFDHRAAFKYRIRTMVLAPVLSGTDAPLGMLTAEYNESPGGFTAEMATLVLGFAHLAALAILGDREEEKRRLTEEDLKRALHRAEESDRLKSAFLANMSHEIRTPLNVILGYTLMIGEHLALGGDDSQAQRLAVIRRAGDRLSHTIHDVLEISRIEAGACAPVPEPLCPADLLGRLVEEFRPLAEAKGLRLTTAIEEPNVAVAFDEKSLTGALVNLLDNAIKFTLEGEVGVRLGRDAGGRLSIEVRDTGIGIGKGYLPRLFEPFSQEETGYSRHFEGSGLGLALVRRYLALNGATIEVESEKGRGSLFRIRFAAGSERTAAGPSLPANAGVESPEIADANRPAILVVEDDTDTQEYMKAVLGGRFRVIIAATALEARERLEENAGQVPLILMDLSLRGSEDGLMLTRYLRSNPRWQSLPIIATTAHAFEEDRRRALDAGCNAYFAKPFAPRELIETMGKFLRPHAVY